MTGECEPQERTTEIQDVSALEARNLAFYGTNVIEGRLEGIVIRVANQTVMGSIAKLVESASSGKTNLAIEMSYFMRNITIIAVAWGVLFFILSLTVQKSTFLQSMVLFIGIVVANIPEGILATITLSLAGSAKKMASKKALVKSLAAVETLGSTSVICTDKTGTLTLNKMTVVDLFFNGKIEAAQSISSQECIEIIRLAALCNRAVFTESKDGHAIIGDASESALLQFSSKFIDVQEVRRSFRLVGEIPFSSVTKHYVSLHEIAGSEGEGLMLVKGAPELIIEMCSSALIDGASQSLSEDFKALFSEACRTLASAGKRILGCCQLPIKLNSSSDNGIDPAEYPRRNMQFVGLFALMDPPKPNVREAIESCQTAGIKVIMVTGDNSITAEAIARQVQIIKSEKVSYFADLSENSAEAVVVAGSEIPLLSQQQWDIIMRSNQIVFARTTPQQKYLIVEEAQKRGNIVAVTGDGVNDSPALKKADIGISMGISGSDVSKEAADMILLDDNFATIVEGIKEGRIIFDNLKKSIAYTLSSNIPELVPFILMVILQIPLPLSTILILCVDLGTDMYPAISLANEKAETDIMHRKPRRHKVDRMVNWKLIAFSYLQIGIIQAVAAVFAYFFVMSSEGFPTSILYGSFANFNDKELVLQQKVSFITNKDF